MITKMKRPGFAPAVFFASLAGWRKRDMAAPHYPPFSTSPPAAFNAVGCGMAMTL